MEEDDDAFTTTNVQFVGKIPSGTFASPPREPEIAGAIVLNNAHNALVLQIFDQDARASALRATTNRRET